MHNFNALIAVEGIDGTGKSTLSQAICSSLDAQGFSSVHSAEPTKGQYGRKWRELLASGEFKGSEEIDLLIRDREEHVARLIRPSLSAGMNVILDRYYYSMIAYQTARGYQEEFLHKLNDPFPAADLLIRINLDVSVSLQRLSSTRRDKDVLFENQVFLEKVRKSFDRIKHPNILDLDGAMPTNEQVQLVFQNLMNSTLSA